MAAHKQSDPEFESSAQARNEEGRDLALRLKQQAAFVKLSVTEMSLADSGLSLAARHSRRRQTLEAITIAAADKGLPSGHTIFIGPTDY
jgi:hypothetical protein